MNAQDAGPLLAEVGKWAPWVGAGVGGVGYLGLTIHRRRNMTRREALKWRNALEVHGVKNAPRVIGAHKTTAGECLTVEFREGGHVKQWEGKADEVAAALGVRSVQFLPVRDNARRARVNVNRLDPLAEVVEWPLAAAHNLDLLGGVRVGKSYGGADTTLYLVWNNLLIGGVPGSGKSNLMSLIIATAALDPNVDLWLIDGKHGVEMACWAKCANAPVATSLDDAMTILFRVNRELTKRYKELLAHDPPLRKIRVDGTHRVVLLVIDELATFTGDKDFNALLENVIRMGRAAGVIVVAATQKPSADVVPSRVRDLFTYRLAFRCTTPQASDTILGQGWAGMGFDATLIEQANKGEGWLLEETGSPERMRAYVLEDEAMYAIAARAGAIRRYGGPAKVEIEGPGGGKLQVQSGRSGVLKADSAVGSDEAGKDANREVGEDGPEGPVLALPLAPAWPRLPARDLEILTACGEPLGRKDIETKWFGGKSPGASKRLVVLVKLGLLDESRSAPQLGGAAGKVYSLSDKGREFLASMTEGVAS